MALYLTLLGDPGRVPFLGHFRAGLATPTASWAVAGRARGGSSPESAHHLARAVEAAVLRGWGAVPVGADRFAGVRAGWLALRELQRDQPTLAETLDLLFVGVDNEGRAVAGAGLTSVWQVEAEAAQTGVFEQLAGPDHPLAGHASWLHDFPGVLQLPVGPSRLVAVPLALAGASPEDSDWHRRCGWRGA